MRSSNHSDDAVYAIFSSRYKPLIGGVERYTESLANALSTKGSSVVVATLAVDGATGFFDSPEGVTVLRLPCRSLLGGRLPMPRRNAEYRELMSALETMNVNRVLVNTRFYAFSIDGLRFARRVAAKAVLLDHGSAHIVLGKSARIDFVIRIYEHWMTARTKRFNPVFCGVSQRSTQWLSHFGIAAKHVLPNAIDVDSFVSSSSKRDFRNEFGLQDRFLAVFVGRLAPEKGVLNLMRAAELLENDEVSFLLVGDGPLKEELERSNAGNIHLAGSLDASDVSAVLQQSDLFVLPTRSEGFCTALLEAAACGVPAVITDVGGARELIPNDEYGCIIDDAQPETIAAAIKTMLDKAPDGLKAIGARVKRRTSERYNWAKTAETLEELYR